MNAPKTELKLTKVIRAKREKVFAAWTKSDLLKQWFHPGEMTTPVADVELKVGGHYRVQMQDDEGSHTTIGQYREIIPNQKLVFTWGWEGPERHETLVTVEFLDKDGGTEVILTHTRFANAEQAEHHKKGWNGCLENLSTHISNF